MNLKTSLAIVVILLSASIASAQGSFSSAAPRPWGRVSFFTNASQLTPDTGPAFDLAEVTTAFSYQLPEDEGSGLDYGIDLRHSRYSTSSRPDRLSVYEAFLGARVADGAVRFRVGHLWLNDLGALGSVAGGTVEIRQPRFLPSDGRFRAGFFAGLEPNIRDTGYAPNVRKVGGYLAFDGEANRRHTVGYVRVQNESLIERSAFTTTNYWPVAGKLFVYQAAEYDLQPPAGRASRGLAYLFATARVVANDRTQIQGTYNRGHSVDVRGLSQDVLSGRPISQSAAQGLLYESIGGRVTVEVIRRVRVYGGYSTDKNSRSSARSGRILLGGYASNVANSGWDVTASETLLTRSTGRYHSRYLSVGRQVGRNVYTSLDYTTSLSVVRFSRSDGLIVETRPHTTRWSGTASINLPGSMTLLATAERTRDDSARELRLLAGITYRIR